VRKKWGRREVEGRKEGKERRRLRGRREGLSRRIDRGKRERKAGKE
jgi:hypothetical protein